MEDITDFYAWTRQQAEALRRRAGKDADNEIDWENVAEEIEALGRSDRRQIRSRVEILLLHLLKWKYQPAHRSGRWRSSIVEARTRLNDLLDESPSLKNYPQECLEKAFTAAARRAQLETGLLQMPEDCPWTIEQVLDDDFLP